MTDFEQQEELESIIHDLEEENMYLMEEYNRLQSELNSKSLLNTNITNNSNSKTYGTTLRNDLQTKSQNQSISDSKNSQNVTSRALSSSPTPQCYSSVLSKKAQYHNYTTLNGSLNLGSSSLISSQNLQNNENYNKLPTIFTPLNTTNKSCKPNKETQILEEARLLRQHEDRLEARMKILENHNRLLDAQLKQLKGLLNVKKKIKNVEIL